MRQAKAAQFSAKLASIHWCMIQLNLPKDGNSFFGVPFQEVPAVLPSHSDSRSPSFQKILPKHRGHFGWLVGDASAVMALSGWPISWGIFNTHNGWLFHVKHQHKDLPMDLHWASDRPRVSPRDILQSCSLQHR